VDDARRSIGRDVERDLDQQPAFGSHEMDPLVVLELGRAGEGGVATAEVEHGRRQRVGTEAWVTADRPGDGDGLPVEHHPRHVDRIAADVHQGSAAELGHVADVGRIQVAVREERLDGLELADRTVANELAHLDPQRVQPVHEGLHEEHACGLAAVDHLLGLGGRHRQRLLAQHVLAGRRRPQRPRRMEVVGQRDVHGLDVRIVEELLVAAVVPGDAQFRRRRGGPRRIA
jgi:hypothetical protein